jgi:hypothetical protein
VQVVDFYIENDQAVARLDHHMALPHAIAALLNSGRRGQIILSGSCSYDTAANSLDILAPTVTFSERWPLPDGCFLHWEPATSDKPHHIITSVFQGSSDPYFVNIDARTRVCARGVSRSAERLRTAILDIELTHVLQARNVQVNLVPMPLTHFGSNKAEGYTVEYKEITWWDMKKRTVGPVDEAALVSVVVDYFKQYIVEMYVILSTRTVVASELHIGTRDGDLRVVGVPISSQFSGDALRRAISEASGHLFPSPPLRVEVLWSRLDTSGSLKGALRDAATGQIVVLTQAREGHHRCGWSCL